MAARLTPGTSATRLRLLLLALFVALALPSAVLVLQTQRQLRWEAFHQQRTLADELALRIDTELQRLIAAEEARGYADYGFFVVAGEPGSANFLERSPLSRLPPDAALPGLVGYFQVDADGVFSTPLLPEGAPDPSAWGMDAAELAERSARRDALLEVLSRNRLVRHGRAGDGTGRKLAEAVQVAEGATGDYRQAPGDSSSVGAGANAADAPVRDALAVASPQEKQVATVVADDKDAAPTQSFDELNAPSQQAQRSRRNELGRLDELRLAKTYQERSAELEAQSAPPAYEQRMKANVQSRAPRKEQAAVLDAATRAGTFADLEDGTRRVRTFESELDPFELAPLDDRYAVLFRKVWRDGRRTIQGALIEQQALLDGAIVEPFRATALAEATDLVVAWNDDVVRVVRGAAARADGTRADALEGTLLHQLRLSAPFGDLQLVWNVARLPAGPGGRVVAWSAAVLFGVLVLGLLLVYRLGLRQIVLARQQQDFVAAVSHELKTPLTSIRMCAEILRAGWAPPDKQREYFDYMHDESERLSRLIANVLQLARMERNELDLELKPTRVAALMDVLRSKVASPIERAGFSVGYAVDPACAERELEVDADAFVQIVINLVDNALKFSARAERRALEIAARPHGERAVAFSVRDFGPGVEKSQMKKIFALFYRPGSELTRETLGTGIGLALVRQLARAMGGDVDVVNREPGAEFVLVLPVRA